MSDINQKEPGVIREVVRDALREPCIVNVWMCAVDRGHCVIAQDHAGFLWALTETAGLQTWRALPPLPGPHPAAV